MIEDVMYLKAYNIYVLLTSRQLPFSSYEKRNISEFYLQNFSLLSYAFTDYFNFFFLYFLQIIVLSFFAILQLLW